MKSFKTTRVPCVLMAILAILSIANVAIASVIIGGTPPAIAAPAPGEPDTDIGQDLFEYIRTDFYIAGPIPIVLKRIYRSGDIDGGGNFIARPFGLGNNLNYDMYLYSQSEHAGTGYTDAEIVVPDGGQIVCNRTSSCTQQNCSDYTDAIFECTSNPDAEFFGATISYNANTPGWDVTRRDLTVYSFGLGAPLQSIRDRYGNQITLVRSGGQGGDITQINSSNNRYINLSYTDSANPHQITEATDNSGTSHTYAYDSQHRLTSVDSGGETFAYGSSAQLGDIQTLTQWVSLFVNTSTTLTYANAWSGQHGLSKMVTPSGTWSYAITLAGGKIQINKVTDPNGNVRKYTFNNAGYLTSDIRANGTSIASTTTYTRDTASNHILSVTDNIGRVTSYTYDALGNLTSVTKLSGTSNAVTTTYAYEPRCSQLASVTDPLGHGPSMLFDSNCNATTIIDPNQNNWTLAYNNQGQLKSITDPNQPPDTWQFGYDSSEDPASLTDPLGNVSTVAEDAIGRVISATDPLRNTSSWTYTTFNGVDEPSVVTDEIGDIWSFEYEGLGLLINYGFGTYPYGLTGGSGIGYSLSSPITVSITSGAGGTETYVLDPVGNVTSYTDKRGLVSSFTYDALNRLTKIKYNSGNNNAFFQTSVTYTYDGADRVTQLVDTGGGGCPPSWQCTPGNTQTFVYDGLDRVTSLTSTEGAVTYTYDKAGRRTSMQAGSQPQVNYTYDNADDVLTLANGSANVSITYDNDGRRKHLTLPNGVSVAYAYDAAWDLSSLAYSSTLGGSLGNLTYTYDPNGRIVGVGGSLAAVNLPAAVSATYNGGNQLTVWNGANVNSDQANNLLADPTIPTPSTLDWNERNQLESLMRTEFFNYDALGRRETSSTPSTNSTSSYLYDGVIPVRTTTNGTLVADVLAMPGTGEIFARTDSSGLVVLLTDGIGSTIGLVDSTGTIATQYTYEPFGRSTTSGAANANPFKFAGMESDSSGLYHTWARYYSPGLQRFVSEDPLGLGGGDINIFGYANNDPVNGTDPLGLFLLGASIDCEFPQGLANVGDISISLNLPGLSGISVSAISVSNIPSFGQGKRIGDVLLAADTDNMVEIPPLNSDPSVPPGPGWLWVGGKQGSNSGSYLDPVTGWGLHPDFGTHGLPKGDHYDLQRHLLGGRKQKYGLTMNGSKIQLWSEGTQSWTTIFDFEILESLF